KSATFTEGALFCTLITLPVRSITLISLTFNPLTEVIFNTSVTGFGYIEKFSLKKFSTESGSSDKSITILPFGVPPCTGIVEILVGVVRPQVVEVRYAVPV